MNLWKSGILAVLVVPALASADTGKVTISQAIRLALENNHQLKAAQYEKNATEAGLSASRSRYLPSLNLHSGGVYSNMPSRVFMMKLDEGRIDPGNDFSANTLNNPVARGDFYSTLMLEQPLLDFSIATSAALAGKEVEARSSMLAQRREDVAFKVLQSWLEIRRAKAFLQIAEQAVADAREHLRLALVRNSNGVGLKSDELRAKTYLSQLEGDLITANNDVLVAKMRLNQVIGGKVGEQLDIVDEPLQAGAMVDKGALVQIGIEQRHELKVVAVEVDKAELGVSAARKAYLPAIYASAAYQINDRDTPFGTDNKAWSVGMNLRWELFDGFRRSAAATSAAATVSAARESLENQRSEVALQVEESLLRRNESAKRVEVARNAVLDAEEGVRLIGKRFENSLAAMIDLLDAQTALNRARASLVEVENNNALATARVYHSAGIFLKETLK